MNSKNKKHTNKKLAMQKFPIKAVWDKTSTKVLLSSWVPFVLANYLWIWGLPWSVVNRPRETPLEKTNFSFSGENLLQWACTGSSMFLLKWQRGKFKFYNLPPCCGSQTCLSVPMYPLTFLRTRSLLSILHIFHRRFQLAIWKLTSYLCWVTTWYVCKSLWRNWWK